MTDIIERLRIIKSVNTYPELVKALEEIEKIIADHERLLILPSAKDVKDMWNIARKALAVTRLEREGTKEGSE